MRKTAPCVLAAYIAPTILALTAGCTSPDPGPPITSPEPDVSTPGAEEDQAVVDATAALHRFYEALDQCYTHPPNVDSSCFDSVAADQVLTDYRSSLESLQSEGMRFGGHPEILSVEVVWINLNDSPKQIRLAACVEQRTRQPVDSSGALLVPESAIPTTPERIVWQLINRDYPEADQWKVYSYYPEEGSELC